MMRRWTARGKGVSLVCFICLVCMVRVATAGQPDQPDELVGWDVLPNGMVVVQYDRSGDGIPDHIALHQITWSGWTAQEIREIEAQARVDGQWVFIVEYDHDRFVYLTKATPLFWADDPAQRGDWVASPVEYQEEPLTNGVSTCPVCRR